MYMSRRLSRAIFLHVPARPLSVWRNKCASRALKCVWCTSRNTGTENTNHHAAVMTNEMRMPSSCPMPKLLPKSTMTRHTMNGMQDPI